MKLFEKEVMKNEALHAQTHTHTFVHVTDLHENVKYIQVTANNKTKMLLVFQKL